MSLSRETVQTLVTGEHGDPFAVLGPHAAANGVIVRVFLPGAVEVSVVPLDAGSLSHPLKPLHPAGLWEGELPGRLPVAYRVRASYGGGHTVEIEDPYRFPRPCRASISTSSGRAPTTGSTTSWGRMPRRSKAWRGSSSRCGRPMRSASP